MLGSFSSRSSTFSFGHSEILILDRFGGLCCPVAELPSEVRVLRLRKQELDDHEGAICAGEAEVGLHGAARGTDGLVRVLDLYHHAQRNVVARNPAQRPVLKTVTGDNYSVALSQAGGHPALTAATPPAVFSYDVLVVYSPDDREASHGEGGKIAARCAVLAPKL